MKRVVYITFLFLLLSCTSKKSDLERIVSEWQGKEILIPEQLTDVLERDNMLFSSPDYTILTFLDTTGCTRCKMKLDLWEKYLNGLDSVSEYNINFVMVVAPKDIKDLQQIVRESSFTRNVFVDEENTLNDRNHFPADILLSSFLLDSKNRVVIIGNPIYNPNIGDLYMSVLSDSANNYNKKKLSLFVAEDSYDLGSVRVGTTSSHKFLIKNIGDTEVIIREIVTSCDCTKAIPQKIRIAPKETISIDVESLSGDELGEFLRTAEVFYVGSKKSTILSVSGTVVKY